MSEPSSSVAAPPSEPSEPSDAHARGRRERTVAVVLALAGAAACLLSGSRTWVRGSVVDDLLGRVPLTASGREAAPVVVAVAVVALAAALAAAVGRWLGRTLAGLVLVLAGAAATAGAVSALSTPASALTGQVLRATARTGAGRLSAAVTGWPWVAVVGGVLMVLAGGVVVVRARRWSGPSNRFETSAGAGPAGPTGRSATAAPAPAPSDDPGLAWDALSRGDDPTRPDPGRPDRPDPS